MFSSAVINKVPNTHAEYPAVSVSGKLLSRTPPPNTVRDRCLYVQAAIQRRGLPTRFK
jgi:hypothetical protein